MKRRTIAAVFWGAAEQVGANGLNSVVVLLVARTITPADFGVFAAASLVATVATRVATLGLDNAAVQLDVVDRRTVGTAGSIISIFSTCLALVVYITAPSIATVFGSPRITVIVRLLAIGIPLNALSAFVTGLIRRALDIRRLAVRSFTASTIAGGITVISTAWLDGVVALVVFYLSASIAELTLSLRMSPHEVTPAFSRLDAINLIKRGLPLSTGDLLAQYNRESPRLFAAVLLGVEALGVVTLALRAMLLLVNLFGTALTRSAAPIIASARRSAGRVSNQVLALSWLVVAISVPGFAIPAILRREAVAVALGAGWEAMAPVFGLLMCAGFMMTWNFVSGATMIAMDANVPRLWFALVRASVGTVLLVLFGNAGAIGIATAVLVRAVVVEPWPLRHVLRLVDVRVRTYVRAIRGPITGGFVLVLVTMGSVQAMARTTNLSRMLIASGVGLAAYALIVHAIDRRTFREFYHAVKSEGEGWI